MIGTVDVCKKQAEWHLSDGYDHGYSCERCLPVVVMKPGIMFRRIVDTDYVDSQPAVFMEK